jgi:hypothetical protein
MKPLAIIGMLLFACVTLCSAEEGVPDSPKLTDLPALLKAAEAWGVPRPHRGSRLVKVWAYGSGDDDKYLLGFIEPGDKDRALLGFITCDISEPEKPSIPIDDPSSLSLDDVTCESPFGQVFGVNKGLITGIQLVRMEQRELGIKLINKSLGVSAGHAYSPLLSPAGEDPVLMLARNCLSAAMNEVSTKKPDFGTIYGKVERLLRDKPELKSEATDNIIEGLDASRKHVPAEPGTIEALIDDYMMSGGYENGKFPERDDSQEPDHEVFLRGFDTVPSMIKLRGSKRFTNHMVVVFNNMPSYPMSVDQVANAFLMTMARSEFGTNWLDRRKGGTSDSDAVNEWWERASQLGEREYARRHTIHVDEDGTVSVSMVYMNIARDRYPDLLPGFYLELISTPESTSRLSSWALGEEIIRRNLLPRSEMIELFKKGVATGLEEHRNGALSLLRDLDDELADKLLLSVINDSSGVPEQSYANDQDARLGWHVAHSRDLDVWQAMRKLIHRGDTAMRMELIDGLAPGKDAPEKIISFYLSILDQYRADSSWRENARKKDDMRLLACHDYDILGMEDFIHIQWADWLDLKLEKPAPDANVFDWAGYGEAVSKGIDRYKAER